MTPLHWAVEREHVRIIHALLEHGADPGLISKFGKTPVSLALERDRLDLVDILQQEREIGIKAHQQSEVNSAELEAATHNLMQLEADEIKDKLESLQQLSSSKQKFTQSKYGNIFFYENNILFIFLFIKYSFFFCV